MPSAVLIGSRTKSARSWMGPSPAELRIASRPPCVFSVSRPRVIMACIGRLVGVDNGL